MLPPTPPHAPYARTEQFARSVTAQLAKQRRVATGQHPRQLPGAHPACRAGRTHRGCRVQQPQLALPGELKQPVAHSVAHHQHGQVADLGRAGQHCTAWAARRQLGNIRQQTPGLVQRERGKGAARRSREASGAARAVHKAPPTPRQLGAASLAVMLHTAQTFAAAQQKSGP